MHTHSLVPLSEALTQGFCPKWVVSTTDDVVLSQDGFARIVRAVVREGGENVYDLWIVDNPPAAAVAALDHRGYLGLVHIWRPVTEMRVSPRQFDLTELGRWRWELPRGLAEPDESLGHAAIREGSEELRCALTSPRLLGYYHGNSSYVSKPIPLYVADAAVGPRTDYRHDEYEGIRQARFFSPAEVRTMILSGEVDDGYVHSACAYLSLRSMFDIFSR
jgi:8-oxo-dGTP pyrophosphatase MutT (NUDIX family)